MPTEQVRSFNEYLLNIKYMHSICSNQIIFKNMKSTCDPSHRNILFTDMFLEFRSSLFSSFYNPALRKRPRVYKRKEILSTFFALRSHLHEHIHTHACTCTPYKVMICPVRFTYTSWMRINETCLNLNSKYASIFLRAGKKKKKRKGELSKTLKESDPLLYCQVIVSRNRL